MARKITYGSRRILVRVIVQVARSYREPASGTLQSDFPRLHKFSCESLPQQMNTVDLERLKEQEDAAIKIIDSWPRIFQLLVYRQLYAFGIRISNIDSEIEKELKKSA